MPIDEFYNRLESKNPKAVRSTCSRKFEFSFLNRNLMVRAGILLIFDTGGAASTMIARLSC
jgi:hypothetical protein